MAATNPNLGSSVDDYLNSPFWVRKITTYFRAMDVIEDGVLTLSDYDTVADRIVANQENQQQADHIRAVFRTTFEKLVAAGKPTDATTKVPLDEFLRNTAQCALDDVHAPVAARREKEVFFDFVDTDANGVISRDEYTRYLTVYFGEKAGAGADTAFDSLDYNKDGIISREEFIKSHYHYWFDCFGDEATTPLPYGPLVSS